MKRIFIIAALVITSLVTAQSNKNEEQSISMYDGATLPVIVKMYRAKIDLSLEQARYSNPTSYNSFEEMKEQLLNKLSKRGIKKSEVIENKADYYINGRSNEGTTYELVTSDKAKVTDFISVVMPGVTTRGIEYQIAYDESSVDKNISESLNKMKKRAQTMAKGLGFNTAKVSKVDISQSKEYKKWIRYKEDGYVTIAVKYILE